MVCDKCKKEVVSVEEHLKDKNGEQVFCPNCLCEEVATGQLILENDETLRDDVTGEFGAVEFCSSGEHYILKKERMIRLICHNLEPDEWKTLTEKYGEDKFELHEDFYDDDGFALQPLEIIKMPES